MIEQLAEMPAADAYQVPGTVDLPDLGAADLELLNNSTLALNNSNLVDLNQPVDSPNKRRRPNEDASEKETRSERSTKARRTLETDSEHQRNESKAKASRGKFASEQQEKGHKKEREGLLSLFEEPKANGSNALEQGVEEQVEQTIEDKVPETPSRDQSTASAFVSLHLSPVGPSPRAATKRKKTLIMDKEIMISRSEIRENFENNSTSYQRGEVLNELFKITERSESSSVLLQEPTRKAFKRNSTIRKFWKKHARTETYTPREKELRRPYHLEFTVPGYSWQNDTRDESIEQERVGTPLDRSRQLSTGDISLTDRSQRRASSSGTGEPEGTAGLSTSLLNTTDVMPSIQEEIPVPEAILEQEQEPQVDVGQAEQAEVQDQQLPLEEAIPQDVLVPPAVEPEVPADLVNDVPPEEQAVLEEAQPTSNKQDKTDDVARSHRLVLPDSRRFRFSDLIYPHYKRLDVARAFHSLLELCARRQVRVRQKESFGDIDIIRAH